MRRPYEAAAAQLQIEIYNTVRSLLANRRTTLAASDGYMPNVGGPSIALTELLSALTLLQNQAIVTQTQSAAGADAVQLAQQVKQELLDQAGKFHGTSKVHVAGADEDTIDLVGMFVRIHPAGPQPAAADAGAAGAAARFRFSRWRCWTSTCLRRSPILRGKLLDNQWPRHAWAGLKSPTRPSPARQGQADGRIAAQGFRRRTWRSSNARATDFESFLETNKKRADLAEQRAAEATRGREKLHSARRIFGARGSSSALKASSCRTLCTMC